jgi:hypothetical protein
MIRHAVILTSLILLAACASGTQNQRTTQLLDRRLTASLATDVAAGRATVQALPDGDRVTLLGASPFPTDAKALDDQRPDVRANVIQALLDPTLMRVQVADTSTLPDYQRDMRVRNVTQYFVANGLEPVLIPAAGPDAAPVGTSGLVLTIRLECPAPNWTTGYGDGRSHPVCD